MAAAPPAPHHQSRGASWTCRREACPTLLPSSPRQVLGYPGALSALHLSPSHWGAGPGSLLRWVSWDQGIQS